MAPVYTTAKMKAFHREIVDILEDVVVGHKDAMLNAANIWRRGDLVRRSIHDIQVRAIAWLSTVHVHQARHEGHSEVMICRRIWMLW